MQHGPHPPGEMRRKRELAPRIAWDHCIGGGGARHERFGIAQALETHDLAGKHECLPGAQLLDEVFINFTERAPADQRPVACWSAARRSTGLAPVSAPANKADL